MLALVNESLIAAAHPLPLGAGNLSHYFEFSGVMHPAISHFPIALLTVAGLIEAWSVVRRERRPANATLVCLSIGTLAAVAAAVLGWADADRLGYNKGETISLHRWLGIAVAVLAVVAMVLSLTIRGEGAKRKLVWAYRANLFITAGLVGLVGSLGGKLVHGEDYYTEAWAELAEATSDKVVDEVKEATAESVEVVQNVVKGATDAIKTAPERVQAAVAATAAPVATPTTAPASTDPAVAAATTPETPTAPADAAATVTPAATPAATSQPATAPAVAAAATAPPVAGAAFGGGRIDYARDIQPIFEAHCVKCHNDKKTKGDYRMDSVQHLFAAGEMGQAPIVAGKSADSLLVKLIEGKGEHEDSIMPPKGDPLTFQQITLIRQWIDEGAQPSSP